MNEYQFSLKQLFIVMTLFAMFLGIGKWCIIKYDDRICEVTSLVDLQIYEGKRVSMCGRYQYLGTGSSFQLVWIAGRRFDMSDVVPIAISNVTTDGSPLPKISDDTMIVVTGRLTNMPNSSAFSYPIPQDVFLRKYKIYNIAPGEMTAVWFQITAEEVRPREVKPTNPGWHEINAETKNAAWHEEKQHTHLQGV
jgi:hypothetical protein